ncbi:DUF4114 domain-containing protein [Synechocystis sp. LEGE 06083]|nr:DUF4114 domain-containing protein [Synechocystis sp. LEGE 06083]
MFVLGGTLDLNNVNFSNNSTQGGSGANSGQGLGGAIFAIDFNVLGQTLNKVNLTNVSFNENSASSASGTVDPGTISFGTAYNNADILGSTFSGTVVAPGSIATATQFKQTETSSQGNLGSLGYNLSPFKGANITTQVGELSLQQTDAFFHNLFGLYEVINLDGAILDSLDSNNNGRTDDLLNPGDAGYALTALTNRVDNFVLQVGANGDPTKNTTASKLGNVLLEGGKLYAPWAIANGGSLIPQSGTVQDAIDVFLAQNPNNVGATLDNFMSHTVAYFSFGEANPDGAEHLQNRGNGVFGFEDLPSNLGISDFDFNDAVFQIQFLA